MPEQTVTLNRKARHEYSIEETVEAGLVLTGTEIKSVRAGRVNLNEAYARVEHGEAWLVGAHIAPFEGGNRFNHESKRTRKLLLHRGEIDELLGLTTRKGLTLVPLRLYISDEGAGQGRARSRAREAAARPPARDRGSGRQKGARARAVGRGSRPVGGCGRGDPESVRADSVVGDRHEPPGVGHLGFRAVVR